MFVAGAEYGAGYLTAEIYNPLLNSWTYIPAPLSLLNTNDTNPPGQQNVAGFSDSESMMLPDGRDLVAPVYPLVGGMTAIYDPNVNTWSAAQSLAQHAEECWVKLADDSILVTDFTKTSSERYIPALNQWIADKDVGFQIWNGGEMGAGLLLPDGRAFFMGGTGRTALYTPSGNTNVGTWAAGPNLPTGGLAQDVPAAMMVDGNVLCVFTQPSGTNQFYEYDYLSNSFTLVTNPVANPNPFVMLDLPDGTVLYEDFINGQLFVYRPSGFPLASGKPTILSLTANANGSFHLTGTLLNGISAGATQGDDFQMDSNYPLVRLTNNANGNVYYARTFNWSSTSVQASNRVVSTELTVPALVLTNGGSFSLVVVANGIASDPITFPQPVWVDFNYAGTLQNGSYPFPYKTLINAISAVPTHEMVMMFADRF